MILHLFIGDLYVEKLPKDVKFLKISVRVDLCREHAISSDLYLSHNIVRFNQTMHFPVDDEANVINELNFTLLCTKNDASEQVLGTCSEVCTSGEHSLTKFITINDHRGVLVGKVPVTSFYYASAIKLGDHVRFKQEYEPNSKEYAFLLARRLRHAARSKAVTFDRNIEHQLNNDARDLIARDFSITSAKARNKKKPTPAPPKPAKIASSAPDSLTYNPGMTRNGAISDAARGRVARKAAVPHTKTKRPKPAAAEKPKLRETYMSVGYVKDKQWPERDTGEVERNLYRLHQASEMKLQILKDIAQTVKQRNLRTAAKQEAIRREKQRVALQEGKLKRVLKYREAEIQLLKGTLTHLRLTSALKASGTTASVATPKITTKGFSRLHHLLYPTEHDSTYRAASPYAVRGGAQNSSVFSGQSPSQTFRSSSAPASARRRSSTSTRSTPRSASSGGSVRRRPGNVSFADASSAPAPLYNPLPDTGRPYDGRAHTKQRGTRRAAAYNALHHLQQQQTTTPNQEDFVDQLSEAFGMSFAEHNHVPHNEPASGAIAKDWLASARASINEFHRPGVRTHAPSSQSHGAAPRDHTSPPQTVPAKKSPHSHSAQPNTHQPGGSACRKAPSPRAVHQIPSVTTRPTAQDKSETSAQRNGHASAQHGQVSHPSTASSQVPSAANNRRPMSDSTDSSDAEYQQQRAEQANLRAHAPAAFLQSLVAGGENWAQLREVGAGLDNTVSSIAVGDIPYFPASVHSSQQSEPHTQFEAQRHPSNAPLSPASKQSSDSLEDLSVPAADNTATGKQLNSSVCVWESAVVVGIPSTTLYFSSFVSAHGLSNCCLRVALALISPLILTTGVPHKRNSHPAQQENIANIRHNGSGAQLTVNAHPSRASRPSAGPPPHYGQCRAGTASGAGRIPGIPLPRGATRGSSGDPVLSPEKVRDLCLVREE
jgi:hypothetical protein